MNSSLKPVVHLMYGFVGAGKTTFAKNLECKTGAIRFTHDEWMARLYGSNPDCQSFKELYDRVSGLIMELSQQLVSRGQSVILDFGFWKRAERDEVRAKIKSWGGEAKLYYIKCPEELMRERVLQRTADLPEGALYIDANAIEEFKARFEPLEEDEDREVIESERG